MHYISNIVSSTVWHFTLLLIKPLLITLHLMLKDYLGLPVTNDGHLSDHHQIGRGDPALKFQSMSYFSDHCQYSRLVSLGRGTWNKD